MAVLRAKQGDTVELMVFEHYGHQGRGLIEAVLDAPANKGLSALGPVLPIGTIVTMPDEVLTVEAEAARIAPAVNLWD